MQLSKIRSLILAGVMVLAMAGVASAHASVLPKQTAAGTYEKFSLRVPSEKEIPTVKVRVEFPEAFQISRVQPMPGWAYTFEKSADGTKVSAITWSGGEIAGSEFQEFVFQGKTPKEPGKYSFRAYQTYKDGTVAEWTGPSDAKSPAPVVEVAAGGGAETDDHGASTPAAQSKAPEPAAAQPAPAAAPQQSGGLTPIAAYGGLILGAAALVVALRKR